MVSPRFLQVLIFAAVLAVVSSVPYACPNWILTEACSNACWTGGDVKGCCRQNQFSDGYCMPNKAYCW